MESLLRKGARREYRCVEGDHEGQGAADVAGSPEVKLLLENYEKRLCMIVCDEVGKKYNTNVFNDLLPEILEYV